MEIKDFDNLVDIHLRLARMTYIDMITMLRDNNYINNEDEEFAFVVAWFGDVHKYNREFDKSVNAYVFWKG